MASIREIITARREVALVLMCSDINRARPDKAVQWHLMPLYGVARRVE